MMKFLIILCVFLVSCKNKNQDNIVKPENLPVDRVEIPSIFKTVDATVLPVVSKDLRFKVVRDFDTAGDRSKWLQKIELNDLSWKDPSVLRAVCSAILDHQKFILIYGFDNEIYPMNCDVVKILLMYDPELSNLEIDGDSELLFFSDICNSSVRVLQYLKLSERDRNR